MYTFFLSLQRWVWAGRKEGFTVRINTNNGIERQNKLFKHSYLKRHKTSSLSGMLAILIEEFQPDNYNRYISQEIWNQCTNKI